MSSVFSEGSTLGDRYRLERVLGVGGMASVWLAHDERLHRPVALKILSDSLLADPSYLDRFRREAQLAAALSHPNLVRIYDFGGDGERPYLAMEYIDGETLAHHISTGGGLLGADLRRLADGLLGALEHICRAGIIHRDIKPANVMITSDGAAKLADFGIAQPENATRLTRTGLVVGTRSYMAPEVLNGEPATSRSDLYSFGVVLIEAGGEQMPADLESLAVRLTAEDPTRRPRSASEALAVLRSPDPTAPTEPLSSGGVAVNRSTAPTAVLPAGAVDSRPTAVKSQHPRRAILWVGALALLAVLAIAGISLLSSGESPDRDAASRAAEERQGDPQGGSSEEAPAQEATTEEAPTDEATTEGPPTGETATPEAPTADPAEDTVPTQAPSESKGEKPPKEVKPPGKAKGLKKD